MRDRRRMSKRLATKQLIPIQTPIPPQTSELTVIPVPSFTVIAVPNFFDDTCDRMIPDLYNFKENVW